jgi:hypothetical protein
MSARLNIELYALSFSTPAVKLPVGSQPRWEIARCFNSTRVDIARDYAE